DRGAGRERAGRAADLLRSGGAGRGIGPDRRAARRRRGRGADRRRGHGGEDHGIHRGTLPGRGLTMAEATAASPRVDRARLRGWLQEYGVYAAVAALLLFNVLFTPHFVDAANVRTQLVQVAPIVIVSLGMALVIGTQGIDLSVG